MLVTVNPIPGESYNIGGTYSCTVGEMLNFLISLSNHKDRIKVQQDTERLRPLDADLQVPDTSKFKAHTGWEPEIPFEKTMKDLLQYWRESIGSGRQVLSR
jgi:GDPmannose 4,6-dehydratase